jgi:hypothetical protein
LAACRFIVPKASCFPTSQSRFFSGEIELALHKAILTDSLCDATEVALTLNNILFLNRVLLCKGTLYGLMTNTWKGEFFWKLLKTRTINFLTTQKMIPNVKKAELA